MPQRQPDHRTAQHEPRRIHAQAYEQQNANDRHGDRERIDQCRARELPVTTAMSASDATLTPSSTAPAVGERRNLGTSGPLSATKTKAGRKIPTVATAAPAVPPSTKPMKVAVVNTGQE